MPRLDPAEEFWMVTRKTQDRSGGPKVRHGSYADAIAEAHRLSNKLGETFVVLWAANEVRPQLTTFTSAEQMEYQNDQTP